MTEISIRDARRLFLHRQGLLRRNQFGRGRNATLRAVEQLGYVQIDTISVMARAHHHVLKTRVDNYTGAMLNRLQYQERQIFEYWSHAAAYLPMRDYRFYLPMMRGFSEQPLADAKLTRQILTRIRNEGPLQSKDFENPAGRTSSGWWDWKPAKRVLESLFLRGELMVARRDGFQKVYDLTENVLPQGTDTRVPTRDGWCRFIALRMLGALGIATAMDVGYARTAIRKFTGTPIQKELESTLQMLARDGRISRVNVGGHAMYALPEHLETLPHRLGKRQLWFLSPFDNLVINRSRTRLLFDFEYQIECYVPEKKRQFGYYCLPILWGDMLIGRLDAKAERDKQRLRVHLLQIEPKTHVDDTLLDALAKELVQLAIANDGTEVHISRTEPAFLKGAVTRRMG